MPRVEIRNLSKRFGNVQAVNNVSHVFKDGELTVLLGPSGCGKTTILRCIAGVEIPESGTIVIGDRILTSIEDAIFIPPEQRNMGMVHQNYAVWPHMRVFDNVAYPLRMRKMSEDLPKKVSEALDLVGLTGLGDRYPSQLSGGQLQRVALARSIVYNPEVLLLDEPLSNLDAKLRLRTRVELKKLVSRLKMSSIYVTHDQAEAFAIGDTIAVVEKGQVSQVGSPSEIYLHPRNEFIADFIGETNLVHVKVIRTNRNAVTATFSGGEIVIFCSPPINETNLSVSIRPTKIVLYRQKPDLDQNLWRGKIVERIYYGDSCTYFVSVGKERFNVRTPPDEIYREGEEVYLHVEPERCVLITQVLSAGREP